MSSAELVRRWVDVKTGLVCMLKHNAFFACLMGYVKLPNGHPWVGSSHSDIDYIPDIGYMTFAGALPGDTGWWIGFDKQATTEWMADSQKMVEKLAECIASKGGDGVKVKDISDCDVRKQERYKIYRELMALVDEQGCLEKLKKKHGDKDAGARYAAEREAWFRLITAWTTQFREGG